MKKILSLILALAMLASITACSKKPVQEEPEKDPDEVIIETDAPAEEGEEPAEEEKEEAPEEQEKETEQKPEEEKAPEVKPEAKPEAKPTAKPEAKPETKPAEKPAEPETKPEEKPAEPEAKPEQAPETEKAPEANDGETVGATLSAVWRANSSKSTEEIANAVISHSSIQFMGGVVPVEEGLLTGFDNTEIKGFKSAHMFAPGIGTIPFVGYVFELSDGTDADAFVSTLKSSANPRWNICTQADQTIVEKSGNKVFFLMCPRSFEE